MNNYSATLDRNFFSACVSAHKCMYVIVTRQQRVIDKFMAWG